MLELMSPRVAADFTAAILNRDFRQSFGVSKLVVKGHGVLNKFSACISGILN